MTACYSGGCYGTPPAAAKLHTANTRAFFSRENRPPKISASTLSRCWHGAYRARTIAIHEHLRRSAKRRPIRRRCGVYRLPTRGDVRPVAVRLDFSPRRQGACNAVDLPGDGGTSACWPVLKLLARRDTRRGRLQLRARPLLPHHLFGVWRLLGRGAPRRHLGQIRRPHVVTNPPTPAALINGAERPLQACALAITAPSLPGVNVATPDARAALEHTETAVTDYYAGAQLYVADTIDKALPLAGLTNTIDSQNSRACIQARQGTASTGSSPDRSPNFCGVGRPQRHRTHAPACWMPAQLSAGGPTSPRRTST